MRGKLRKKLTKMVNKKYRFDYDKLLTEIIAESTSNRLRWYLGVGQKLFKKLKPAAYAVGILAAMGIVETIFLIIIFL